MAISASSDTVAARLLDLVGLAGDPRFREQVHYPEVEPGIYQMDGVVSRKKQLLPYLTQILKLGGGAPAH